MEKLNSALSLMDEKKGRGRCFLHLDCNNFHGECIISIYLDRMKDETPGPIKNKSLTSMKKINISRNDIM